MKKYLFLFIFLVSVGVTANAQISAGGNLLPYQKSPNLPAFHLLMLDSSTIFNTYYIKEGKPTALMFFSPDCDHCQKLTKELLAHMPELKNVQFYFFTPMDLYILGAFYRVMGLKKYPNITVGRDYEYFFPDYYGASSVPYIVVYDRHKKFVQLYKNIVTADAIIAQLKSL